MHVRNLLFLQLMAIVEREFIMTKVLIINGLFHCSYLQQRAVADESFSYEVWLFILKHPKIDAVSQELRWILEYLLVNFIMWIMGLKYSIIGT